ncbi:abortive infection family protein [Pontibacter virosus]|uniref:Abortive infection Abi-like protein n=1 Tax=Pontibacter virosus TaxID=1765052 RepID=A0A2U1B3B9_9BACT|nr:abortive infection family protein [Pontibacter virosus]PVY43148.1 abortive infection Abi-like protein [Pontibacter virosus]
MSDLSTIEKHKLEKLFGMGNGYVLDFSDKDFQSFVLEAIGLDILDDRYKYRSGSKANRLRGFWEEESNFTVGKLSFDLIEYWKGKKLIRFEEITASEHELYEECIRISDRLKQQSPIEHIDAIQANNEDKDFLLLAKLIRASIEKNEPEAALDRLHTFVVKYIRELCRRHNIEYSNSESLNSIFGKYVKQVFNKGVIQSAMAEKILKYSIQIIDAFNDVRNNRSFAHDNTILNYHESILIFNNISSSIHFISELEKQLAEQQEETNFERESFKFN